MKRFLFAVMVLTIMIYPVYANLVFNSAGYPLNQPLQEYFSAEDQNYNRSIIYIFFNNDQDCYQCPQTVEITEQVYNQYYSNKYSMFVINYAEDTEYDFATAYKLNSPLAIVLVKIENGNVVGYQKINNPQNMLSFGEDYILYLKQQIDTYLGS